MRRICMWLLLGAFSLNLIGCANARPDTTEEAVRTTLSTEVVDTVILEDMDDSAVEPDVEVNYVSALIDWGELPPRTTDITVGEIMGRVVDKLRESNSFAIEDNIVMYQDNEVFAQANSRMEFNNVTGELYTYSESTFEGDTLQQKSYVVKRPTDGFDFITCSEYITNGDNETFSEIDACYGRSPMITYPIYELLALESYMDVYQDSYDLDGTPHFVLKNFMQIVGEENIVATMYINANDYTITRIEQVDAITGSNTTITFEYDNVNIVLPEKYLETPIRNEFGDELSETDLVLIKRSFDTFEGFLNFTDCEQLDRGDLCLTLDGQKFYVGETAENLLTSIFGDCCLSEGYVMDLATGVNSNYTEGDTVQPNEVIRYDVVNYSDNCVNSSLWLYNPGETECSLAECLIGAIKFDKYYENAEQHSVSMGSLFDMKALFGDKYEKSFRADGVIVDYWDLGDIDVYAEDLGFMWNSIVVRAKDCPDNIDMFSLN